jgi:hypothetical protein
MKCTMGSQSAAVDKDGNCRPISSAGIVLDYCCSDFDPNSGICA